MTTWLFDASVDDDDIPDDVLDITLRFEGDVTVCELRGPLCAVTAASLDAWLGQLRDAGRDRVRVDAAGLTTLSSDGIAVLRAHADGLAAAGGRLQVRHASPAARRALHRSGADELVEGGDAAAN